MLCWWRISRCPDGDYALLTYSFLNMLGGLGGWASWGGRGCGCVSCEREMVGAPQRDRRVGGVVARYGGPHALRASFAGPSTRGHGILAT